MAVGMTPNLVALAALALAVIILIGLALLATALTDLAAARRRPGHLPDVRGRLTEHGHAISAHDLQAKAHADRLTAIERRLNRIELADMDRGQTGGQHDAHRARFVEADITTHRMPTGILTGGWR